MDVSGGIAPPNSALAADNQGWTIRDGLIQFTSASAVVDGVEDLGGVYVPNGTGGTVENSLVGDINYSSGGSLVVRNTTIDGGTDTNYSSVMDYGTGKLDVESVNASGGGHEVLCYSNCTVRNSWLHDNYAGNASAHQNGILADGGSNNYFAHNSVYCTSGGGCTGDITLLNKDGTQINETISSNLLLATNAAYCSYPGPNVASPQNQTSGITWNNNVFQRGSNGHCATYGSVYGWYPATCSPTACVWSNNIYDNGTVINP